MESRYIKKFTCDRCGMEQYVEEPEHNVMTSVILYPDGWNKLHVDNNKYDLCKRCYDDYLNLCQNYMRYGQLEVYEDTRLI